MSLRWRDRGSVLLEDAPSTRAFLLKFGIWTALIHGFFGGTRATWFDVFHWYIRGCLTSLHGAALGLALGWAQLWILSRLRWKVDGWVRWTLLAILLGNLATSYAVESVVRLMRLSWQVEAWISGAVWSASFGLLTGLALGAALWKSDWPPEGRLWVSGRAGVTVIAWAASMSLTFVPFEDSLFFKSVRLALGGLIAGFLEGAGTAWLLDRLFFRPERGGR